MLNIILGIFFGFLPTMVAYGREKESSGIIFALNLLLGLSIFIIGPFVLLGWIFLLIWAFSVDSSKANSWDTSQYKSTLRYDHPKKECPRCKSSIDSDCTSCPKCGERFSNASNSKLNLDKNQEKWRCKKCGSHNPVGKVFCGDCNSYK
ncbi:UNVERIFIED_CONTAM: T4 superinfection immunity protein [Acetivibrio alkalicellulosi]